MASRQCDTVMQLAWPIMLLLAVAHYFGPANYTSLATFAYLFISNLPSLLYFLIRINCTLTFIAQVLHRLNHCRCPYSCSSTKAPAQVRCSLPFRGVWICASPSQFPLFPTFISSNLEIPLSHFLQPTSRSSLLTLSHRLHLTIHTVRTSTYKMHTSTLLTFASTLALASAATGALGDAAVVQKNPAGVTYTATLPNSPSSGVRGYVSGTSNANGTGVLFSVSLSGFPAASLGPFRTLSPLPPRPSVNRPLSVEGTKSGRLWGEKPN